MVRIRSYPPSFEEGGMICRQTKRFRERKGVIRFIAGAGTTQIAMILPNDIILRTTSDGTTVWVSQRLVVECCGVSEDVLRTTARKRYKQSLPASWQKVVRGADFLLGDSGKAWRWGRRNGQYYYDYDRIPDRAPAGYRSQLPLREELEAFVDNNNLTASRERQAAVRSSIAEAARELVDNSDGLWINAHSGYQIDMPVCRDYARALAWCRFMTRVVREGQTADYGVPTVGAFYDACAGLLADAKLSNFRVTTGASLRKKLIGFPAEVEDQRRWIISGKIGNDNSKVVDKINLVDYETGVIYPFSIHKAIMYAAYLNLESPVKESLTVLYNETYVPLINEFGVTPVSERAFCSHLSRFSSRLLADRGRHGNEYYNKQLLTYIPSTKLQYAHSLFCGDGSGLFAYHYTKKDGTESDMNLYAMLITDVATGYIAGYSVAPAGMHCETPAMVQEAVRMAVRNGGDRTMFEFVSDNHGAFTGGEIKEWLQGVFNMTRTITPHNSQANPAETMFRLFKRSSLRSLVSFIRSSHNATIANRANLDKANIWEYPTYNEAVTILGEQIDKWNNKVRPHCDSTPAELFATTKNAKCQPIDAVRLRKIYGMRTKAEMSRMRGIVKVGPKGRELQYLIPDYATTGAGLISRATGNGYYANVKVIYDTTGADLYAADGTFILTCPPVCAASQSYVERTEQQRFNQMFLEQQKEAQLEAVARLEQDVADAYNVLNEWGDYGTAVKMGGDKESINGAYEASISKEIFEAQNANAAKELKRMKRKEATRAAKKDKAEASDITARHLAQVRGRVPKEFLNN